MSAQRLNLADAFAAVDSAGEYHANLAELRRWQASGVYAILDRASSRVLYVGESHTGRLYDTITRHFRRWDVPPQRDGSGRRQGGTQYDRRAVNIAYLVTPPGEALERQYAEIERLAPEDNEQGIAR